MKLTQIPQIKYIELLSSELAKNAVQDEKVLSKFSDIWAGLDFYKFDYVSDGRIVKGYLVEPKIGVDLPCIIFNRGGSKDYGKIDERVLFFLIAKIASWGYSVIASQYSGNDGGEGKDECGGMDVNDMLNLKDILDQYDRVDSSKIGMFGGSRGGMMTYIALKQVDWIKAAVIRAGSSNEIRGYKLRPSVKEFRSDMYDVHSEEENIKRSGIFWVDQMTKKTPLLLIHGTGDDKVSPLDALEMGVELYKNNIPFELHVYQDDDHKISKNSKEAMEKTHQWFDKYVKNI
jgi:dipeptidyl aminopeptidase/acylaminoacyl peptidase